VNAAGGLGRQANEVSNVVDQTGKPTRGKARSKRPIIRHPLFPAIVALWSAALFGIVALAIKPALLPALIAAAIGGVFGLGIAKRFAPPKPAAPQAAPAMPAGDETPLWSDLKTARQALIDEAGGRTQLADDVPNTDREPQTLDIAEVAMEPLGPVIEPSPEHEAAPVAPAAIGAPPAAIGAPPEPVLGTAAQRIAGADLADLSHVELLERLAISLQRRGHQAAIPEAPAVAEPAEPTIVFPARAERGGAIPAPQPALSLPADPQNPQDTEKALRDALTALQRMSGTA
jgi:hypothetical protein